MMFLWFSRFRMCASASAVGQFAFSLKDFMANFAPVFFSTMSLTTALEPSPISPLTSYFSRKQMWVVDGSMRCLAVPASLLKVLKNLSRYESVQSWPYPSVRPDYPRLSLYVERRTGSSVTVCLGC